MKERLKMEIKMDPYLTKSDMFSFFISCAVEKLEMEFAYWEYGWHVRNREFVRKN